MFKISLPQRNTRSFWFSIGEHSFLFSYERVVAYHGPLGQCRRKNSWGPTTGRHLNENECKNYPIVTEQEMNLRQRQVIADVTKSMVSDALMRPKPLIAEEA